MKNLIKGRVVLDYEKELEKLNYAPEQINENVRRDMYYELRDIMTQAYYLRDSIEKFNHKFKRHTYIESYYIPDSSWGTDGTPLEEAEQSIELQLRTNQEYSIPAEPYSNKFLSNHTLHELFFGSRIHNPAWVTINYDESFLGKRYTGEEVSESELRNNFMNYINKSFENVYFISNGFHIKIGRTNNLRNRLANLQTSSSLPLEIIAAIETDNSVALESIVHDHFKDRRTNGEWFDIDKTDVVRYIESLDGAGVN